MANKKAFTTLELLVVMIIIGIMFVTLVAHIDFMSDDAKKDQLSSDLKAFEDAIVSTVYQDWGFPETRTELIKNLNANIDPRYKFVDSTDYFVSAINDPWGKPYKFVFSEDTDTLSIHYSVSGNPDHKKTYSFTVDGITGQLLLDGEAIGSPENLVVAP